MSLSRFAALALCVASVAACNTTDPNKGGFLGGVGGLTSGSYQRGVDEREKKLQDSQDQNLSLERRSERKDAELKSVQSNLNSTEAQLAALNSDANALERKLAKASSRRDVEQAELARLQREITELGADIDQERLSMDDRSKQARMAELQKRKDDLSRAISQLLGE